jgi:hypothetical protein
MNLPRLPKPRRPLPPHRRLPLAAGAVILWITLAPWIWGFADNRSAVANHIFFTFAFGPLALMIAALRPAAFVAFAGGVWLVLSPWVLGYATDHAAWLSEFVSGGLLVVVCAHAAGVGAVVRRRGARGRARTAAGGGAGAAATVEAVNSRS